MTKNKSNLVDEAAVAAMEAAAALEQPGPREVTLSTGYRAILSPAPSGALQDAMARIKDPQVPMVMDNDKGRKVPNEFDPEYVQEKRDANDRRNEAALNVMLILCVEIMDIPPQDEWLPRLQLLEEMGTISLEAYDLKKPHVAEFVFKKFLAVSQDDILLVQRVSALTEEALAKARDGF